jgi:hypothetical protein
MKNHETVLELVSFSPFLTSLDYGILILDFREDALVVKDATRTSELVIWLIILCLA